MNVEGDSIYLADYIGKVVLIQFTSIGCGPCYESIIIMKNIKDFFNPDIFELLSIESYIFDEEALLKYKEKHNLNYNFLIGNRNITSAYFLPGVPTFYIIDKKGVMKKVIVGFKKGITKSEIQTSLVDLI
jgi:thiol-disulfide isomerase/thioredoxin